MRVIAGSARGVRLCTLPGKEVARPTVDRVKEGVFSAVQFLLPGAQVLDLFAGSGQLGIEALSRGAAGCIFVDESRAAVQVIEKNLQAARLSGRARLVRADAESFLLGAAAWPPFDLVVLDPPYRRGIPGRLLPLLAGAVAAGGVVLCETEKGAPLPRAAAGLVMKKQYRYGTVQVTRYEKPAPERGFEDDDRHLPGQL